MISCERCQSEIEKLEVDDCGDEIDWNTPWEQYLCEDCYNQIWDDLFKSCCPQCRTEPCKRGRECWIKPWPRIMYLCYVAPKKQRRLNET